MDGDLEMRRAILDVIQKRIDTGVLAAGAGLQDHSAGAAKPKRAYKRKAQTVAPVPAAEPDSSESPEGGKRKRKAPKKKGGSALDRPTLQVTGSTDGGGGKPESAWIKEIKAVQKAKNCSYSDAMRLASAARKAKK